jgi:chaperone required for assembly of F1-ATPase
MADAARMKRFWKEVAVEQAGGGWRVTLDGRAIKTQGGTPQVVPSEALAELLAAEWRAQGEEIDPAAIAAKLMRYGETDTLCYRADPDEPLHQRQWAEWEPIVTAFEAR